MSRERVESLTCDWPGCEAELMALSSQLVRRARAGGWQAREVASLSIDPDDGPDVEFTDQCPDHPIETVREVVRAEAGGGAGQQ